MELQKHFFLKHLCPVSVNKAYFQCIFSLSKMLHSSAAAPASLSSLGTHCDPQREQINHSWSKRSLAVLTFEIYTIICVKQQKYNNGKKMGKLQDGNKKNSCLNLSLFEYNLIVLMS